MDTYPRVYIKPSTHKIIKSVAKKQKTTQIAIGDKIVRAGLRALGYIK